MQAPLRAPRDLNDAGILAALADCELRTDARTTPVRGLFDLFQDDDVDELFEMSEPADAALAGHTPLYRQLGVVDQRIEAWFTPFDWTTPTGYLHDHDPRPTP